MALLGLQGVKRLGHQLGIAIQEGVSVALEGSQAFLTFPERRELPLGGPARLLEVAEPLRIATCPVALPFYHLLKTLLEAYRGLQESRDEFPDLLFRPLRAQVS